MFRSKQRFADAHKDEVWAVCFAGSGNDSKIVSASLDETAKVWATTPVEGKEAADGKGALLELSQHRLGVLSVAAAATGSLAASSSLDGHIRVFNTAAASPAAALVTTIRVGPAKVWTLAFHPDGMRIASGSHHGDVNVFDCKTGQVLATFKTETSSKRSVQDAVLSVAFSPNGKYLACGSTSGNVSIFDVGTGKSLHGKLNLHAQPVRTVAFNNSSSILLTGGDDGYVNSLDVEGGEALTNTPAHEGKVLAVSWHVSGQHFATSGSDGRVRLWDSESIECVHSFDTFSGPVWGCSFNDDGKKLVACGSDRAVEIFDTIFDK